MKVNFVKGQVKQIFDFNQEAKHIFERYMFTPNGFVVGEHNFIGTHYIEKGFNFQNIEEIQEFISNEIYELLKTGRKNITEWERSNNFLYTINGKVFGYGVPYTDNDYFTMTSKANKFAWSFINSSHILNLNEDDVYDLTKNKIIDIKCGEYSSRISRKVIPGLKKSHKVQIRFYESDLTNVFYMHIKVDRKVLVSHHIYQCIKF